MVKPWDMAHCDINTVLLGDAISTPPRMKVCQKPYIYRGAATAASLG